MIMQSNRLESLKKRVSRRHQRRYVAFDFAAFLGILLTAILLSWVFARIVAPLPTSDVPPLISDRWAYDAEFFYDDSYEFTAFFAFFLAFFTITIVTSVLIAKLKGKLTSKFLTPLGIGLFSILVICINIAWRSANAFIPHFTRFPRPLGTFVTWPWSFIALLTLIVLYFSREFDTAPKWYFRIIDFLVGISIIWSATWYIYSAWGREGDDWNFIWHITPIFSPIYEISQGRTLGVDLNTLYGFYGYFFVPIQRFLFGDVTVYGTISIFAFLVGICGFALYFVLRHIVPLPWAVVGTFAILWIIHGAGMSTSVLFQQLPMRSLMPSLMLVSLVIYERLSRADAFSSKHYMRLSPPIAVLVLAIIWSPEAAIIVTGIFLSYFAFFAFWQSENWQSGMLGILKSVFITFVAVLLGIGTLQLITLTRSGQFISLNSYFWGIRAFAGDGLLMHPLHEQQPWSLLLFTYSVVLAYCIYTLFSKKNTQTRNPNLPFLFTLAITGVAVFANFLGGGGLWRLLHVSWPGWILVTYFLYKTDTILKSNPVVSRSRLRWPLLVLHGFISVLLVGNAMAFFNIPRSAAWEILSANRSRSTVTLSDFVLESQQIIAESGVSPENIAVIDHFAPLYLAELNIQNQFVAPSVIDSFFRSDFDNMITFVEQHDGPLFIGRTLAIDPAIPFISNDFTHDFQLRLNRALTENFILIKDTNEYGFGTHLAFYMPRAR